MSAISDAENAENVAWLNGNGLRVHPRSGVVHTAWCRTQSLDWGPGEFIPWPKYADDEDRPCKTCKPSLDLPTTPARAAMKPTTTEPAEEAGA